MSWLTEGPFWIAFTGLYVIVTLRGQGTYWLARVVTEQALRRSHPEHGWWARTHTWLQGERPARGRELIHRWGLVAVPLCHLTVGFQTLVLAGAGMLRIGWLRFTLAQVPGALAWALIYATIGFAVFSAAVAAFAGSPLALAGLIAILIVIIASVALTRRRHRARAPRENVAPPTS